MPQNHEEIQQVRSLSLVVKDCKIVKDKNISQVCVCVCVCVVGVWGMYVQEGMVGLQLISLFSSLSAPRCILSFSSMAPVLLGLESLRSCRVSLMSASCLSESHSQYLILQIIIPVLTIAFC